MRRTMPCVLANSTACSEMCDWWLSIMRRIGRVGEHLLCFATCSKNSRNLSSSIHPDLVAHPIEPVGLPLMKWSLYRIRGKTNIGGIEFPTAFTAQITVTSCPRSIEVTAPTCLLPLGATTCFGDCTVVTPVSSALYMSSGANV